MPWRSDARRAAALLLLLLVAACAGGDRRPARPPPVRPAGGMVSDDPVKVGRPYTVLGLTYTPVDDPAYDEVGIASWYGQDFHGRATANGERYDMNRVSAAHKTMPLPSYLEVTSLRSGKRVLVRVNDRGPFVPNRIVDLSRRAAQVIGLDREGIGPVRVRRVYPGEADRLALRAGGEASTLPYAPAAELAQQRQRLLARAPDPRPAPPPVLAPALASRGWYAQVGAYGDAARAQRIARELGGQVTQADGLYRVRLGPYLDEPSATLMLAQLGARGYQGGILIRPGP